MVKFKFLVEFPVYHFLHSVVPSLTLFVIFSVSTLSIQFTIRINKEFAISVIEYIEVKIVERSGLLLLSHLRDHQTKTICSDCKTGAPNRLSA